MVASALMRGADSKRKARDDRQVPEADIINTGAETY